MKLLKNPIFWIVILVGGLIVIGYKVMVKTAEQQEALRHKEKEQVFTLKKYDLFGVAAIRPATVLAVGSNGMLLQSPDKGDTWEERQIGSPEQVFSAICFPDDKNGWIVGTGGMILHTEDGGKNWKQVEIEGGSYLRDVFFIDADNGWIVGEDCTILRTADGGKTWDLIETDLFLITLTAVEFFDKNRGWSVGEQGTVMFSSDGGRTWKEQNIGKKREIEKLTLGDDSQKYFGGSGASYDDNYKAYSELELKPTLMSLTIVDENTVMVAGLGGALFITKDGGDTWKKNPVKTGTGKGYIENHVFKIFEHELIERRKDYNTFYMVCRGAQYYSFDNMRSFRPVSPAEELKVLIKRGWFYDMTSHPVLKSSLWMVGKWGIILELKGHDWLRIH